MERKYIFMDTGVGCLTFCVLTMSTVVISSALIARGGYFAIIATLIMVLITIGVTAIVDIKRRRAINKKKEDK